MLICVTGFTNERYEWLSDGVYLDTQTVKHCPKVTQDYLNHPNLVAQDDGYIDAWIKIVYTNEQVQGFIEKRKRDGLSIDGFEKLSYSLIHWHIKTNRGEIKHLQSIEYDSNGNVMDSYTAPDYVQKWLPVIPDALGETCQIRSVIYMEQKYRSQKFEQKKQQWLKHLLEADNLENQFYWVMSDDKKTISFDIYSVELLKDNIVIVRIKKVFNQDGVRAEIEQRKRSLEGIGDLAEQYNDEKFLSLKCEYKYYAFDLKSKKYINLSWVWLSDRKNILNTVIVPEFLENKWYNVPSYSFEDKLIDVLTNWINENQSFVNRKR